MIRIDSVLQYEGVTVYRDETQPDLFYAVPQEPRIRLDAKGLPMLKLIKYAEPRQKPDGTVGGGLLSFDSELVMPDDVQAKLQKDLDNLVSSEKKVKGPARFGTLTYQNCTATFQMTKVGGEFIESVMSAGKPSMYGNNVASFSAELTQYGATFCEQALTGLGGVLQIIYDVHFPVKTPPMTAHVWFNAMKFYSYYQTLTKTDSHWWNGNSGKESDTRREDFMSSQSGGVKVDLNWPGGTDDELKKLQDQITDWGFTQIENAVKACTLSDPTANTDTGMPDGVNSVTRDISSFKSASFDETVTAEDALWWELVPQGTLPNLSEIKGIDLKQYITSVDLNDPFFRMLNVTVNVDIDFATSGVDSIDFWILYGDLSLDMVPDDKNVIPSPHITSADTRLRYQTNVLNNNYSYTYGYSVQYKDSPQVYKSPVIADGKAGTTQKSLTLALDQLGILGVDLLTTVTDWDTISALVVTLTYEDSAHNVTKREKQIELTKGSPTARWIEVILADWNQPYTYAVTCVLATGEKFDVPAQSTNTKQLVIYNPLRPLDVSILGLGDFTNDWDSVYVDLACTDAGGKTIASASKTLNANSTSAHWSFEALGAAAGTISYSGTIKHKNGALVTLPKKSVPASAPSIRISDPGADNTAVIQVVPDAIDWSATKLVVIKIAAHVPGGDQNGSIVIKQNATPGGFPVKLASAADRSALGFTWTATFYMTNGTAKTTAPANETGADSPIVPQNPS